MGQHAQEEANRLLASAWRGNADSLLDGLLDCFRHCRDPDREEKLSQLIGYVHSNLEGIRNYRKYAFVGSGPVEKTTDIVICRRFKTRGVSWFKSGAANLNPTQAFKAQRPVGRLLE